MKCVSVLVLLLATLAAGQHWEFEQVDTSFGMGLQMRQAPDGTLYLCYWDGSRGRIKVAHRDTAWHVEEIDTLVARGGFDGPAFAVAPDGEVGMVCMDGNEVNFVHRIDTTWVVEATGFTGTYFGVYPRLGFDSAGVPTIAFCYNGYDLPGGILFATPADSIWAVDTVLWAVPQQMYAALFSISDLEYDAADNPHLFVRSGYGVANSDPPWSIRIGTWTRQGVSWQYHPVAGGGFLEHACDLDLATDADCGEHVCYYWGLSGAYHLYCDADTLADSAATDAAVQADSLGRTQVAFVVNGVLYFAYLTGYWHNSTVPVGADVDDCDLLLDSLGQPLIAYSTWPGVWLARGLDVVGVEHSPASQAQSRKLEPTVVRSLPVGAAVFDAMGRRVRDPKPGIYFVRDEGRGTPDAGRMRKVILQR